MADTYTLQDLVAGACMWEHVLARLRRGRETTLWGEYAAAYGMAELRARVVSHAPVLEAAYQRAVENGYDRAFDWEFVPKYMEDHVTRVLI
jgi:uncharacterized protein (DUF1810 family)